MDAAADKVARYRDLLDRKKRRGDLAAYSVRTWRKDFWDIYVQQTHMLPLEAIGFHFLEEAGEELTAIRKLLQLRGAAHGAIDGVDGEFLDRLTTLEGIVEAHEAHYMDETDIDFTSDCPAMIRARLVAAKMDTVSEFADTFSWFCSVLNKIKLISGNCGQEGCEYASEDAFEQRLTGEYLPEGKPRCPTCHKCPCECAFFQ